jgi:hypothetical protein
MTLEIWDYGSNGLQKAIKRTVSDSCGRGYEVYEKEGRLLVMAYAVNEAANAYCVAQGSSETRYRPAALAYLGAARKDQHCVLGAGRELSALHSEFNFACT